jgi:hypothetical protein
MQDRPDGGGSFGNGLLHSRSLPRRRMNQRLQAFPTLLHCPDSSQHHNPHIEGGCGGRCSGIRLRYGRDIRKNILHFTHLQTIHKRSMQVPWHRKACPKAVGGFQREGGLYCTQQCSDPCCQQRLLTSSFKRSGIQLPQ